MNRRILKKGVGSPGCSIEVVLDQLILDRTNGYIVSCLLDINFPAAQEEPKWEDLVPRCATRKLYCVTVALEEIMSSEKFAFDLGSEVQDKITKYKGIVRARTQYLTGCNTYGLQRENLDSEGQPQDWKWFDEDQLKLLKEDKVVLYSKTELKKKKEKSRTGGPHGSNQLAPHW